MVRPPAGTPQRNPHPPPPRRRRLLPRRVPRMAFRRAPLPGAAPVGRAPQRLLRHHENGDDDDDVMLVEDGVVILKDEEMPP